MIPPEIFTYIKSKRVCVVALEMPDGSPHAAAVHFAHIEEPLTFILQTSLKSKKGEAFLNKDSVRMSLVIGVEEVPGNKEKTFQLDGVARIVKEDESHFIETYFEKFTEKNGKHATDIFFLVTPTWWRFTDWSRPEGKTIYNSDGTMTVRGKILNN